MSKLKISELISFIRRDKNAKCASSTLSSCSCAGMEIDGGGGGGGGAPHRRAIRPCDGHTESWAAISGRIVGVLMEVVEGEAEHGVRCGRLHTVLIE
jgi:hypothetical protein